MEIITNLEKKQLPSSVVTIGAFDGIHQGHKYIFSELKAKSSHYKSPSVVIVFDPHPGEFFNRKILRITNLELQKEKIKNQNIDYLVILKFDQQLSQLSANDFIKLITESLNPKCIVIGHDFSFGHKREGDINTLKLFKDKFELLPIKPFKIKNQIVSSTLIRQTILKDIECANKLLGEPYSIIGEVIKGEGRGKSLGFPTMNLKTNAALTPKNGVYTTKTYIKNQPYNSVTNIGHRPTFYDNTKTHIESHLINFDKDVYGTKVRLDFYHYLREEKKFNSKNDLITQIKNDIKKAKQVINAISSN